VEFSKGCAEHEQARAGTERQRCTTVCMCILYMCSYNFCFNEHPWINKVKLNKKINEEKESLNFKGHLHLPLNKENW